MGRPPSNGGPSFRFNPAEIAEMEAILQAHKTAMPAREVLVALAEKFSNSEERKGKIEVQMKQVWNWFQNRRYAIRAKAGKSPGKLSLPQMTRDDSTMVKGVPQATQPHVASSATVRALPQVQQHPTVPSAAVRTFPQAPQNTIAFSVQSAGRVADNSQMEYEAKSARDGAWYDVSTFLSHRSFETGDPEVLVRFAGFGAEEDEWVNVRKNVRQRSLPCEASECVAVLPADLILCFQEGKEQALYFDAHVLDAQRRRHDVRGCRCRFLVRYDHDQSEEIVALRKICRRPETDYRLQQLHAVNESLGVNHNKNGTHNIHTVSTLRVYPPAEVQSKQLKVEQPVVVPPAEAPPKRQKVESTAPAPPPETTTVLAVQPGDVPQHQQNVQPAPSPQVTQDQHKVEPQKVETVVPVPSEEVPPEMHKVQPVMPDPTGEVSDGPRVAGPLVPPSAETSPPLAASEPPHEPMVCSSSVEVQAELPQVLSASAVETKPEVQAELPRVQSASAIETKPEVQAALPEVQSASAMETKAKVQTELPQVQHASALEAVEAKAEVPPELPQVQPSTANEELEIRDDVQPACAVEAVDTKAEVPEKLPEVQPASPLETVEMKAEVQAKLPQVQHATACAIEPIESEAKVPPELTKVQPETASVLEAIESKAKLPEELPEEQPSSALMETEADVPTELPEVLPASAVMEIEAEEPVVPVCTNDSNVVKDPMEIEAEVEQPKVSEIMDTDDGNDNKVTGDMEQV